MKLTKTSAHAALAMAYLFNRGEQTPTQARQVAEHLDIPTDSMLKILQLLVRQGLLRSQLGRRGGYRVADADHPVTLLQVVEAIDGPMHVQLSVNPVNDGMRHAAEQLQAHCDHALQKVREVWSTLTVADLVASPSETATLAALPNAMRAAG